ncbi:MAG TPA: LytR C-terminal domain-containing protein [Jiangellaceae bacterium]
MALDESAVDDDVARRRQQWRHFRTAITLLVLVVVVVGAAWFSWQNVMGSSADDDPSAGPTCAPVAVEGAPPVGEIQLNVYNATSRSGLASEVADQMTAAGFAVTDVANDPLNKSIEGSAEVRSNPAQQAAASVVAAMVPGAVYVPDERPSATVDLVLGEAFEAVGAPPTAAASTSTLPPCPAPAVT